MTVHGVDPLADPSGAGCVECEAGQGTGWWYHLCRCAQCGHTGCCDSSPLQHAFEMLIRIDAYRDDEVSRAFLEPAYALDVPSVSCLPPSRRPAPTWSPTPASDAKPGPTGTFG
jgi:hypothetical protein